MRTAELIHRVAFDKRKEETNNHAGVRTTWLEQIAVERAAFRYLRGGETVQAARLAGRQPVVVTLRSSSVAASIGTDWRMRDLDTGIVYAVQAGPVPTEDRRWLELTVESGVQP